jgi:uncharacterized damage-inducible protein DinB
VEMDKDALDHLCATEPIWIGALQILQLAKKQTGNEVDASAQIVCALVLLASELADPQPFLEHCADTLRATPLARRTT